MIFHTLTDDQQDVLDALKFGHFKKMEPWTASGYTYITDEGLTFTWIYGMGDGRTIKIINEVQPEWFARKVRKLLSR